MNENLKQKVWWLDHLFFCFRKLVKPHKMTSLPSSPLIKSLDLKSNVIYIDSSSWKWKIPVPKGIKIPHITGFIESEKKEEEENNKK